MNKNSVQKYCVPGGSRLKSVLGKINKTGHGFAVVVSPVTERVTGLVTSGDINRHILGDGSLEDKVEKIMNRKFIRLRRSDTPREDIENLFTENPINAIPVIIRGQLSDVVTPKSLIGRKRVQPTLQRLHLSLVIMAGGKGTRLEPFSSILPKPLIPINGTPMIELIIERFVKYGIRDIYVSVKDKSHMIKAYFREIKKNYRIHFVEEKKPLGTGGSLSLLKRRIHGDFFLSNCDTLVQDDYKKVYAYHVQNESDITIIGAKRDITIPYGVCRIQKNGRLAGISEKPKQKVTVNTGLYILNSRVLQLIPTNQYFDMTDLIEKVITRKGKVFVFTVAEKAYLDVGQWDEYKKTTEYLNKFAANANHAGPPL